MRERIRSDLLTVKLNYRAEYAVQNSLMISLWRRYRGSGPYFCIRYVGNCNNKLLSGAKGPIQHLCWPDSASKAKSHSADRSKTHIWYSVSVKWEDQVSNGEIRELYVEYQPRRFNKWAVECVKKGSGRDDACHKFCTNAFSFSPHCFLFFLCDSDGTWSVQRLVKYVINSPLFLMVSMCCFSQLVFSPAIQNLIPDKAVDGEMLLSPWLQAQE